ncbi:uncharacterized protein LOC116942935 isoform X2 [Petromyzon marinus]|uniref:Uncharacterized protein LOC116942935 isoform X2 n=1 Tax=Petromyzon marinus TaxID=7757 RepID=A0AAJ7T733_PETMA|nr:uncharacterized protein LOC116942935 isoform X2 [Petromyzon marinus]
MLCAVAPRRARALCCGVACPRWRARAPLGSQGPSGAPGAPWPGVRWGSDDAALRVGCASAFWGDTATAVPQLVHGGRLDFLVFDYLSEITMSLLANAKSKAPNMGYTPDFVYAAMAPFIKDIHKRGVRVVSNAGGMNPEACALALREAAAKAGVQLSVAVVSGDDLVEHKAAIAESGVRDLDTGAPFPQSVYSMNAYLGAQPISRALDLGADVVITGRCVDSALVLGPLIHKFGWKPQDYDLLAAGSLAGHLIECGAQCTGGIYTDWHTIPDWDNIGYPVVECSANGSFTVSKPPGTGGLVSPGTVSEQLVYEVGDPRRYLLPDVTCDFSEVTLTELPGVEGGAVLVRGAKGSPPSPSYKVSATFLDGFRATAVCPIGGPRAAEKARRTADAILKRARRIFKHLGLSDFSKVHVQVLGAEDTYGPHARSWPDGGPRDVALWMSVGHSHKRALELFRMEIASAGTSMAPGLTGIVGGRPKISPVLKLFSFLYPKNKTKVDLSLNGVHVETFTGDAAEPGGSAVPDETAQEGASSSSSSSSSSGEAQLPGGSHSYRLEELALTRSGDKADTVNIGVIARHPALYPYLKARLTVSVVQKYFQHLGNGASGPAVSRYELPGIHALNFVLREALGGGGITSLRSDPQGKALGQMLLDLKVGNLPELKDMAR